MRFPPFCSRLRHHRRHLPQVNEILPKKPTPLLSPHLSFLWRPFLYSWISSYLLFLDLQTRLLTTRLTTVYIIYIVYAVEQFKHEIYMRNQQRHSRSFVQSLIIIIALFQKLVNSTKELLLLQEGNANACQFWNHNKSAISVAERCLESKNFSFFRPQS